MFWKNTKEHVLQSDIIDIAKYGHSLVYCSKKFQKRNKININYLVYVYKETLEKVLIPYYDSFHNRDVAYSGFISRLESVINGVTNSCEDSLYKKQHK